MDQFPQIYIEMLKTSFTFKPFIIEEPNSYLGSNLGNIYYKDVSYTWNMVSKTYLEKAVKNLMKKLEDDGFVF